MTNWSVLTRIVDNHKIAMGLKTTLIQKWNLCRIKYLATHFPQNKVVLLPKAENKIAEPPQRTTLLLLIPFAHYHHRYPIKAGSFLPCHIGFRSTSLQKGKDPQKLAVNFYIRIHCYTSISEFIFLLSIFSSKNYQVGPLKNCLHITRTLFLQVISCINKIKSNLNLLLNFSHIHIPYNVLYTNNSQVPKILGKGTFFIFLFSSLLSMQQNNPKL